MHAAADFGCNENAHLMCERSNYGRVLVAAEVMELWRRSGDGLALGTHAPLAIERRPHVPVCPSVGGISVNCQREISHDKTSGESGVALLRVGRFSSKWITSESYVIRGISHLWNNQWVQT